MSDDAPREYFGNPFAPWSFSDSEAYRRGDKMMVSVMRPHLHDVERTATCWCGEKPCEPHIIERTSKES